MDTRYGGVSGRRLHWTLLVGTWIAMRIIAAGRYSFTSCEKVGADGRRDVVTDLDLKVQRFWSLWIRVFLRGFGIIAEEEGLRIACKLDEEIYVTVDPIDGTKALERYQDSGIATQTAVVWRGKVIAAFIGNVVTGEIISYAPGRDVTLRTRFGRVFNLCKVRRDRPFKNQSIVMREPWTQYHSAIKPLLEPGKFFRLTQEVRWGSITLTLLPMLRSEKVGLFAMHYSFMTPWDLMPFVGILERLDFVTLRPGKLNTLEVFDFPLITETEEMSQDILVIPRSRVNEFLALEVW